MEHMPDDAELLRRYAQEKSEAAFTELVQRNLGLVYAAALRQLGGDVHHAQDVAQAVFTALARDAVSVARHPVLIGWLYTTTQHLAAKVRRAEGRRSAREHAAHLMHELTSPDSPAEWEQLRPILDDAMRDLNDDDREVVLLRFFAQRPFAEIGAMLHLSEDAARMRVERALEKLRALLAKHQITSTTAALALALANQPAVALPTGFAAGVASTALTSVNVVTTPAVSLLQIMSSSKIAVGVVGLVLTLTLGVVTREYSYRRTAEAGLATANQNYAAQAAKLRDLERSAMAAEKDVASLTQAVDEKRATQVAAKARTVAETQAPRAEPAWDPMAEGRAFLARHPEARAALVEWRKAAINAKYGSLYRSLGLTPAQVEQFQTVMLDAQISTRNLGSQFRSIPLPAGEGPSPDLAEQLRSLLGEEGFRQMGAIERAAPAGDAVSRLAGALCFTDTPLTGEQSGQLTQLILGSLPAGTGRRPGRVDWDAVMTGATGFLSPPQTAELNNIRVRALALAVANAPKPSVK